MERNLSTRLCTQKEHFSTVSTGYRINFVSERVYSFGYLKSWKPSENDKFCHGCSKDNDFGEENDYYQQIAHSENYNFSHKVF